MGVMRILWVSSRSDRKCKKFDREITYEQQVMMMMMMMMMMKAIVP